MQSPTPSPTRRIHWLRLTKMLTGLAGVLAAPFFFTWSGLAICLVMAFLVGASISVAYHRMLTHRAFQTSRLVRYFWTVTACCMGQGGPLFWVASHRLHHARADRDLDPHSPSRGFWFAQLFWPAFYRPEYDDPTLRRRYVPDLMKDPVICWIETLEPLFSLGTVVAWYCIGELWGVGLSWALWGGVVNVIVLLQTTSLVNSACHRWGERTHETHDQSSNCAWLSVVLFPSGENWHNNHHAAPRSARHGDAWWHIDLGYYVIRLMGACGLAWDIRIADHGSYRVVHPEVARVSEPMPIASALTPSSTDR